jgi:hypothetical protein
MKSQAARSHSQEEPKQTRRTRVPVAAPKPVVAPPGPGNQAFARLLTPSGEGQPLPGPVRRFAEAAFAHDFSAVRIHDDLRTQADLAELDAVAAAYGNDIHLRSSVSQLGWPAAQPVLFHELTHVVQQGQGGAPSADPATVRLSHPSDPAERAADAVAVGAVPADASHGSAAPGTLHRIGAAPVLPTPPPGGLPPGLIAQGARTLVGETALDGVAIGEGTYLTLQPGVVVTGTTTTVGTTATIGSTPVAAGGTQVIGGVGMRFALTTAQAIGVVAIGAILIAGTILVVAVVASQPRPQHEVDPTKEPGTKDLLPGGAPPPVVIAPPADTSKGPVQAPGATEGGTRIAPSGTTGGPVTAPGATDKGPVQAPSAPVDDAVLCKKLNDAKRPHRHHIFPQEYVNEFEYLGININDFTVELPPTEHIGRGGIHINLQWNDRWAEFFEKVPLDLTDAQRRNWAYKAVDYAVDLMGEMQKYLGEKKMLELVKFSSGKPSPKIPPK